MRSRPRLPFLCFLAAPVLVLALLSSNPFGLAADAPAPIVEVGTLVGNEDSFAIPIDRHAGPYTVVEVPGVRGVKRMLLGAVILGSVIAFFYFKSLPKMDTLPDRFLQKAKKIRNGILEMEEPSELEYWTNNFVKYAERNPEIVAGEAAALAAGLVLFLSGVVALGRKRKIKTYASTRP
ncbi:hypothetical protein Efla_003677 [Eimeria flavescens]